MGRNRRTGAERSAGPACERLSMSEVITIVSVMPSYTYRNGRMVEVPDTVISEDAEIHDPISNTLILRPGVNVTIHSTISGTVEVMSGATLHARGTLSGTVSVAEDANVVVHRRASGTIHINRGAEVHLLPGSIALGVIRVEGRLINEGTRSENVSGPGSIEDRPGSTVRVPDRTLPDGTTVYEG